MDKESDYGFKGKREIEREQQKVYMMHKKHIPKEKERGSGSKKKKRERTAKGIHDAYLATKMRKQLVWRHKD